MRTFADNWREAIAQHGLDQRLLLDLMTVRRGIRDFGLWHCPPNGVSLLRELCYELGMNVREVRRLWAAYDATSRERVLRDNPSSPTDFEVIEVWFSVESLDFTPDTNPAAHLGYPICCANYYDKIASFKDYFHSYLIATQSGDWIINRLAGLFTPRALTLDYLPCSLACILSRTLAERIAIVAVEVFGEEYVQAARQDLQAPLLVVNDQLLWNPKWTVIDQVLKVDLHETTALDLVEAFSFALGEVPQGLIPFQHLQGVTSIELIGSAERASLTLRDGRWISRL